MNYDLKQCRFRSEQLVICSEQIGLCISYHQNIDKNSILWNSERISNNVWKMCQGFQLKLGQNTKQLYISILGGTRNKNIKICQCILSLQNIYLYKQKQIKMVMTNQQCKVVGQLYFWIQKNTQNSNLKLGNFLSLSQCTITFLMKNQYKQFFQLCLYYDGKFQVMMHNISTLKKTRRIHDICQIHDIIKATALTWVLVPRSNQKYYSFGDVMIYNLQQGKRQTGTVNLNNKKGRRIASISFKYTINNCYLRNDTPTKKIVKRLSQELYYQKTQKPIGMSYFHDTAVNRFSPFNSKPNLRSQTESSNQILRQSIRNNLPLSDQFVQRITYYPSRNSEQLKVNISQTAPSPIKSSRYKKNMWNSQKYFLHNQGRSKQNKQLQLRKIIKTHRRTKQDISSIVHQFFKNNTADQDTFQDKFSIQKSNQIQQEQNILQTQEQIQLFNIESDLTNRCFIKKNPSIKADVQLQQGQDIPSKYKSRYFGERGEVIKKKMPGIVSKPRQNKIFVIQQKIKNAIVSLAEGSKKSQQQIINKVNALTAFYQQNQNKKNIIGLNDEDEFYKKLEDFILKKVLYSVIRKQNIQNKRKKRNSKKHQQQQSYGGQDEAQTKITDNS